MYFSSRDGRVTIEIRIVIVITEPSGDGGRATVCRAIDGLGKSAEFLLSR
jgi:hypothetical protein